MSEKMKKILYWVMPPIYLFGIYYGMLAIGSSGIERREVRYILEALMAAIVWIAFLLITKKPLFNKRWYSDGKNLFWVCLPGILNALMIFIDSEIIRRYTVWNFEAFIFALTLAIEAGVLEEIQTRGLILNTSVQIKKTKASLVLAVIYSSLLFGLEHFFNLGSGGEIGPTVRTVVFATCCGVYFSALYLRTGSIIPGIVIHGLIDGMRAYNPFVDVDSIEAISTGAENVPIIGQMINGLIVGSLLLIPGLFMLRKSKWDKILDNFD